LQVNLRLGASGVGVSENPATDDVLVDDVVGLIVIMWGILSVRKSHEAQNSSHWNDKNQ
jgi:hypothetical protein